MSEALKISPWDSELHGAAGPEGARDPGDVDAQFPQGGSMLLSTVSNKHGSRESISMEALSKTWEADLGNVGFQKLWISLTQGILCHTMRFHALASKHHSSSPEGGWGSHRNVCLLFIRPSKIVFF